MSFTKHIPNSITALNLFCGCLGIMLSFEGNLEFASYCIYMAAIFDFFDGLAARALNVKSEIGKELDSLADMVSFGVLPGFIVYQMFGENIATFGSINLKFLAFMIPIFSAFRLAKFNLDTRQSDSFIGVPTPANALLISAFPFIQNSDNQTFVALVQNPYFLVAVSAVMSFLLVAELPLLALKFKNYSFGDNKLRWILIFSSAVLILLFKFVALPVVILLYIAISVVNNLTQNT